MLTLSRFQKNMDRDGILMLSLSVFGVLLSGGLVLLWHGYSIYKVASRHYVVSEKPVWLLFGLALKENESQPEYRQRIEAAVNALQTVQPKMLVFQGGVTGQNILTEAVVGKQYFERVLAKTTLGKTLDFEIILEDRSRNTLENLKYTRDFLQSQNQPLESALITNRYHLLRCQVMAENLGFNTEFIPAEVEWVWSSKQLSKVLLEAFFLHWYQTGKFVSQLIKNEGMLNRIK